MSVLRDCLADGFVGPASEAPPGIARSDCRVAAAPYPAYETALAFTCLNPPDKSQIQSHRWLPAASDTALSL